MWFLVLVLILIPEISFSQPEPAIVGAIRPIPFQHLSLQLEDQSPFLWCRVPTNSIQDSSPSFQVISADQTCIDQMEESRTMAVLEVMRFARLFGAAGQKVIDKWVNVSSGLSHIFRDLNLVYQIGISLKEGTRGTWKIDPSGKHYSIENYALKGFQKLFLGNHPVCITAPQNILDILNLKISNGKCIVGANFILPPPVVKYDKTIMTQGVIQANTPMLPLSFVEANKLSAATLAHHLGSLASCGGNPRPASAPSVQQLLLEFEQECAKEGAERKHFCTLMQFAAGSDSRWTPDEKCLIAMEEDRTWNNWDAALRTGKWGESRRWEIAHQEVHAMMAFNTMLNLSDVQILYRFPCADSSGKQKPVSDCPEETQAQVLERLKLQRISSAAHACEEG